MEDVTSAWSGLLGKRESMCLAGLTLKRPVTLRFRETYTGYGKK